MTQSSDAAPDRAALAHTQLREALATADRRAALHDLEHDLRGYGRADYQVIGRLQGTIVIGRQVHGRQTCSPLLRGAAAVLVRAGTILHTPEPGRPVTATLDGRDIATTLTLMRALDQITSARYGDVEIITTAATG